MNAILKDLPYNIKLLNPKNPLSAEGDNQMPVYKYSYHPKTGRLLYCYPGQFHCDAINAVGDEDRFDEYVRVIYDPYNKVPGSRVWGYDNYDKKVPDADIKSFNAQYTAFKFFKKFDPGLKWVLNLTNDDLSGVETLNARYIAKNRILEDVQIEELKRDFRKVYTDKRLNAYWGMWKTGDK